MRTWRNWARDVQCIPAEIRHPRTVNELKSEIERARLAGRQVRVSASGHSFTDIACTDGNMLRLDDMNRVLDVDRSSGAVKVEAGIGLHHLSEQLDRHGLALENMGDIDVQTLGGALSTATHGTGGRLGNLSTQIEAMELVLADGSLLEVSSASDAETWRAGRVALGALGVIATVTLRCLPAFTLDRLDHPLPLAETLDRLADLVDSNDHFEFYVMPYSDVALLRETKRTDGPPKPRSRPREYWEEVLLENAFFALLARTGRRFNSQIPRLNRLAAAVVGSSRKVDRSHRVFASRRMVRFTEMEYAIPRAAAADAVQEVLAMIERRRLAVGFPIEVRFVAADDAFLSPSNGRDTCYVAVHMYRGMDWYQYFRAVEAIMDSHDGRPHWGKRHFQSAATLARSYPDWDRFQDVRASLDPEGVFQNEYTQRVLGATRTSARRRDTSEPRRRPLRQIRGRAS